MPFNLEHSPVIDLINVSVGFADRQILRGLNWRVCRGDRIVIEGATGAGKTVLMHLLLGALPVLSGSGHVLDTDLTRLTARSISILRRSIGVAFQTPRFLNEESVLTNVTVPLAISGHSPARCRSDGTRILMDISLASSAHKKPRELSGGEQARLQIARALIHKPYLLLADEPFAHLDAESVTAIEGLLKAINERGTTVVVTTHGPSRLNEGVLRLRLEDGKLEAVA